MNLRAIAIFLAFVMSNSVHSEPTINTGFEFYDILPSSKYDLEKEMQDRSPIKKNGRTYKGHTHWHVNWKFKWKKKGSMCRITTVIASLSVKYTMPRIPDDYHVNHSVRDSFDRYYNALLRHEKGHMKSGLYAAREIEKELLNLGVFRSCDRLDKAANAKGHEIIKKYNKRDVEYDRATNHGKAEGVDINNFL